MDPNVAKFNNERDIELPLLFSFIGETLPTSLIDVGAAHTYNIYCQKLRTVIPNYIGIDPSEDKEVEKIVDSYIIDNVLNVSIRADFVSCISVIEHINDSQERIKTVEQLFKISKSYIYLTFPYGSDNYFDIYNYRSVTSNELGQIFDIEKRYDFTTKYDKTFNRVNNDWKETTDTFLSSNIDTINCVRIIQMVKNND
jgi:hypothetical protein